MSVTAATITEDGTENEARVPSDTLKVVRGFTIQAGETTIATLDFDAEKSVVVQGTGRYQLKPVIKLLVRKEGEPFQPEVEAIEIATPTATATPPPTATPTVTPTPTAALEPTGEFFLTIEEPESIECPIFSNLLAMTTYLLSGRHRS